MPAKIKTGDRVIVTAGRDKGKTGRVVRMHLADGRVTVEGINVVTRHQRPSQADAGGLKRFEAPIHLSNVAHVDPRDQKPTRVGFRTDEHGRTTRYAKRSGEAIDV